MINDFSKLPYTDRFLAHLESLNEFVTPRALLRYQAEIVQTGGFSLPSPWTGQPLRPVDCFIANISPLGFGDIVIAYRLECEHTLWLISGTVKDGFPINEVYVPAWDSSPWDLYPEAGHRHVAVRAQLRQVPDCSARESATNNAGERPAAPPAILLGHPNFAHTIWNELPGLAVLEGLGARGCEGLGARGCEGLEVMSLCQPILAYEEAFASLGFPHRPVRDVTTLLGLQPRLFTRVGSTQVSEALRRKLVAALRRCRNRVVTSPLERQLEGCYPVVWLSVRLDSRTALNQEDLIMTLVRAVAAVHPGAGFILDGFAFPDDFDNPVYMQPGGAQVEGSRLGLAGRCITSLGEMLAAREREITPYITHLQQLLAGRVRAPIISTSGLRMTDATYLGSLADYYICHAGTLQHKIGWVYNGQGIVHSNTVGVGAGAARWMARQVENGVQPSLIDQSLVSNLDSIRSLNQVDRNRDYQFVDVKAAVSQVLDDLAARLPPATLARHARPTGFRSPTSANLGRPGR